MYQSLLKDLADDGHSTKHTMLIIQDTFIHSCEFVGFVAMSKDICVQFEIERFDINPTETQQWEIYLYDLHGQSRKFLGGHCVTGATEFAPSV